MDRRSYTRFPTDYPAILTPLTDAARGIPVRVQDISEGGVRLFWESGWDEALEAGDFIQLDIGDAALFGEIRFREDGVTGVRIESALIGESDLSKLIEKLLEMPKVGVALVQPGVFQD